MKDYWVHSLFGIAVGCCSPFGVLLIANYIPRRKSGIYWIQVRRAAAAAAAVEISLWTR